MKRIALLMALLAAAPSLAGDEEAKPGPKEVFDGFIKRVKAAAALNIVGSLKFEVSTDGQVQDGRQSAEVRIARPLHGKIAIKSPQFSVEIVADGKAVHVVDRSGKTYRKIGTAWEPIFPQLYPMIAWCPDQKLPEIKAVTREEDGAIKITFGTRSEWFWFDDKGTLTKAKSFEAQGNNSTQVTYAFKRFEIVAKADPAEYAAKVPEGYKLHDPRAAQMAKMNADLLKVGADVPDVTVTDLNGTALKLRDFKGKTLVLNFWFFH